VITQTTKKEPTYDGVSEGNTIFLGEGAELISDAAIAMLESGLSEAFAIFAVISAASVIVALMKTSKKADPPQIK